MLQTQTLSLDIAVFLISTVWSCCHYFIATIIARLLLCASKTHLRGGEVGWIAYHTLTTSFTTARLNYLVILPSSITVEREYICHYLVTIKDAIIVKLRLVVRHFGLNELSFLTGSALISYVAQPLLICDG